MNRLAHQFDDPVMDFCRRCGISAMALMDRPESPCIQGENVEHIQLRLAKRNFAAVMRPVFDRLGIAP